MLDIVFNHLNYVQLITLFVSGAFLAFCFMLNNAYIDYSESDGCDISYTGWMTCEFGGEEFDSERFHCDDDESKTNECYSLASTVYFASITLAAIIMSFAAASFRWLTNEALKYKLATMITWFILVCLVWSVFMMFFLPTWTLASSNVLTANKAPAVFEYMATFLLLISLGCEIKIHQQRRETGEGYALF